jgi:phosphoribosylanthranilate isomerase
MTAVKICGIKDVVNLRAALSAGADFIGFVFYKDSPRYIDPLEAQTLAREIPNDVKIVGLFVNPTDKELNKVLSAAKLSMIQLHGEENPLRIVGIKAAYKIPVMKAIRIASEADLDGIEKFENAADWLLFDTKVEGEHGGTGQSFDWSILKGRTFKKPWMLGGGLRPDNVSRALDVVKPAAVDVSSGVERERGVKDPEKIKAFIEAVH